MAWKTITVAILTVFSCVNPLFAMELLKKEPPKGALAQGQVVYVDDHTCPKGQVKKVIGAPAIGQPRTKSCVPKP